MWHSSEQTERRERHPEPWVGHAQSLQTRAPGGDLYLDRWDLVLPAAMDQALRHLFFFFFPVKVWAQSLCFTEPQANSLHSTLLSQGAWWQVLTPGRITAYQKKLKTGALEGVPVISLLIAPFGTLSWAPGHTIWKDSSRKVSGHGEPLIQSLLSLPVSLESSVF